MEDILSLIMEWAPSGLMLATGNWHRSSVQAYPFISWSKQLKVFSPADLLDVKKVKWLMQRYYNELLHLC